MAVVYTETNGTMQDNIDVHSEDNSGIDIDCPKTQTNAKQTEAEDGASTKSDLGGPPTSSNHAEAAGLSAISPSKSEFKPSDHCEPLDLSSIEMEDNESIQEENVDGEGQYCCVDCGETFEEKEMYLEHCREHTHDGPIVCLDKDGQFDDLLVSQDGGQKTFCCGVCGRKFSGPRGFYNHQLKHRNQTLRYGQGNSYGSHERLYSCEHCGKTYTTIGQYLNHRRSHKQALKSVFHQLEDLKKKSFECPTCGRSYSRASALDAHRRCHEVKLVKNSPARTGRGLAAQETTSENEGSDQPLEVSEESPKTPYVCDCGKTFRSLCGLSTHQRFSSVCSPNAVKAIKVESKGPYKCSECDKQFVSPVALSCHERWHKRRDLIRDSGISLTCQECGRTFTSLTFFHKHQRLAHSEEAPAKSFLHQVCQVQKKAFECQDCGRRFNRESALQSHQLCHIDAYSDDVAKPAPLPNTQPVYAPPPPIQKPLPHNNAKTPDFAIGAVDYSQAVTEDETEHKSEVDYTGSEVDYTEEEDEMDDLNVEVVSVTASDTSLSGSDEEQEVDQNPDLELVCESDIEEDSPTAEDQNVPHILAQSYIDTTSSQHYNVLASPQLYKPDVDVKIVKVNFPHLEEQNVKENGLLESVPQQGVSYECPECGRMFESACGLRCHLLWHRGGMGKKACAKKTVSPPPFISKKLFVCEICNHKSYSLPAHNAHLGKHEDRTPYKSISYQLSELKKNSFKCEECGKRFSRLSAFHSHQQHHNNEKKPFPCPNCNKSYSNSSGLYNHKKTCYPGKYIPNETPEVKTESFNPKKTLLGPKVHHCKSCGKSFWSLGAFSHHRQYHPLCAAAKPSSSAPAKRQVTCPICGIKIRKKGSLAGHIQRHNQPKKEVHTCGECGKSYLSLTCFLKHQLVHGGPLVNPPPAKSFEHQVEQVKKNSYSCSQCGKLFSRAMALQFHIKCHGLEPEESTPKSQEEKKLQSGTPPKIFEDQVTLEDESAYVQKQDNVTVTDTAEKSELASKSNTVSQISSEIKTVHLKYKCADCEKSFAVVGALNFHKRIHRKGHSQLLLSKRIKLGQTTKLPLEQKSGKYPFTCLDCGRHFSSNSALGTHKRWHTDKKLAGLLPGDKKRPTTSDTGPFLCNLCGKGFFYLCVLRRHQKHHPPLRHSLTNKKKDANTQSEPEPKTSSSSDHFSCPECDLTFISGSLLAAHFSSRHANTALGTKDKPIIHPPSIKKNVNTEPPSTSPSDVISTDNNSTPKSFRCPHCPKVYPKIRSLRAHKWQAHRKAVKRVVPPVPPVPSVPPAPVTPPKRFPCPDCEKQYSSQGALYNHRKTCKTKKPKSRFYCLDCGKDYSSQGALYNHKKVCKPVKTETPDFSPITKPKAEAPPVPCKPVKVVSKCFFKCHKCGKAFPSEEQLKAHKDVAKTRPFCCALCCRGYWNETQLQQHLAWHDEVRQRLPTELRYRLSTSVSEIVSKPKTASPHQGKSSAHESKLIAAKAVSPSQKGHKCQHCGKSFLSPFALRQHQAQHETLPSQPTYHCTLCPLTFTEVRDLIDHHQECMGDRERQMSPDTEVETRLAPSEMQEDDDKFTCMDCGMAFSEETELHQHYILHAQGQY